MNWRTISFCLALGSHAAAIIINTPNAGSEWTTKGPNTITWTEEPNDPSYFNIQLVQNNSTMFQPIPGLLSGNGSIDTGVDISSGYTIITPSCMEGSPSLPDGDGFSLHIYTESTLDVLTVIAKSNGTFSIVIAPATACTQTGAGSASSAASSASHSSSSHKTSVAAVAGGIIGGLLLCAVMVAFALLYNRHRRRLRYQETQQFAMQKGLAGGTPLPGNFNVT